MQIARLDHLVLTVADIGRTCDFYTRVLGMEVVTFGEGRTALRFGQQKINLHPADNIPGLVADKPTAGSGDLCFISETPLAEIVAHLKECGVPIIAVTSYALSGDDAKAFAAGCDAYIAKPFSPRALLARVREFVP